MDAESVLAAIVPNFNHGATVEAAIMALALQSRAPDEIIVVDDASTDDSRERLFRLRECLPCLRLVFLERRGGAIAALNRGLVEARSRYVYFGAADDVVHPGLFETFLPLVENAPAIAFAAGEALVVELETMRFALRPPVLPSTAPRVFDPAQVAALFRRMDNFLLTGTAVVRRHALLSRGGFDVKLGAAADGIAMRQLAFAHGFAFAPKVGVEWRIRASGLSRSLAADPQANDAVLAAAIASLRADAAVPDWYLPVFERRWRFAVGRLTLQARPFDPLRVAPLLNNRLPDKTALWVAGKLGGRAGEFLALVWLTLRQRPTTLAGLATTAMWRAQRDPVTPLATMPVSEGATNRT